MRIKIHCRSRELAKFRKNIVPGKENAPVDILFIGEALVIAEDAL
jgi:uracil-DNA glycosylase